MGMELTVTAFEINQLPDLSGAQIALAGRSNVGKSSLVNSLAGRKQLARISSTPGKTRSINFYRVTPGDFSLVDLPGYGYARTSKTERAAWGKLIERYLDSSQGLRGVALLIDARHPPQKLDLEMLAFLQQRRIPVLAVLTKADKCKQRDLSARRREWRDLAGVPPVAFSSKTGQGRDELWSAVRAMTRDGAQDGAQYGAGDGDGT